MRKILASIAVGLSMVVPALAADPVGTWKYDKASFEKMADLFAEAMAARIPPDLVGQIEQQLPKMEAQAKSLETSNPDLAKQVQAAVEQQKAMAEALKSGHAADFMKQQFMATAPDFDQSRLELQEGGKVLYRGVVDGEPQTGEGTWALDGDKITIVAPVPGTEPEAQGEDPADANVTMHGTMTGDRIELSYDAEPSDQEDEAMAKLLEQLRVVLVRE